MSTISHLTTKEVKAHVRNIIVVMILKIENSWLYKLATYPLPRNMGPVLPPSDRKHDDLKCERVIVENTSFVHNDINQKCGNWIPSERIGSELFPRYNVELHDEKQDNFKGPHSDTNMAILYTCTKQKCSIRCSCKICSSSIQKSCKTKCGNYPCAGCITQCLKHRIGLDRAFDLEKHCYSLKVDLENYIKFIVKHTDIPLECNDCQNDLTDHQKYHKIFHGRCKFCKQLMAPFNFYHTVTTDY